MTNPMDDIVTRLNLAAGAETMPEPSDFLHRLLWDAAGEIERLRDRLGVFRDPRLWSVEEILTHLEELAQRCEKEDWCSMAPLELSYCGTRRAVEECKAQIARGAPAPDPREDPCHPDYVAPLNCLVAGCAQPATHGGFCETHNAEPGAPHVGNGAILWAIEQFLKYGDQDGPTADVKRIFREFLSDARNRTVETSGQCTCTRIEEQVCRDEPGLRPDFCRVTAETSNRCPDCGNEIDPTICGCGSPIDHSAWDYGHMPIPMGCDCGRASKSETAP